MSVHPVILLVLVQCLGWKANTQKGSLSDFNIYAEPGPVISHGSLVTVVCSNSGEYDIVRLEKDGRTFMEKSTGPDEREDRFSIGPVNETITGHYYCIYAKKNIWSQRSKKLELKVIKERITQVPAPGPTTTSSDISWLKTYGIYIITVASVIFLLCLSLFLFCFLSHRQKKQGLPNNKRQQQRPEERLNLATNGRLEMTPDIVADDRVPEDRWTETWTPVAGDLQDVAYAQLDHHSLTQRAVGAATSQRIDVMTESSTYAAIIRH
ncbi:leukocyte-associated immunoglobulin-like receptor 1 [Mastomys coucha]|uniref:leukocyte-associated immunoglobulin-like receptor 1 n=1 Tax=Mastomys coucha TaxID=35658 RepID=UPI0012618835|nr:leukocyte-associated immunoglobulin-like receptor 1 [Mastomys coucha]XP_031240948.1 leukocyte-associated immunoglobulin-like receptor 1 [Mastomys coucha]XP_031240949.1 leukocyte-associated immunoglobulin-like receptor 1 [Mastomys coucha]XP_031240950.1 leukocyte-associated immunoglobulin-like receptor 1 [Mastomys coucha]